MGEPLVCIPAAHVPTPVGALCGYCGLYVSEDEQGIGVPDGMTGVYGWWHLDCWMRTIAGQVEREVLDGD